MNHPACILGLVVACAIAMSLCAADDIVLDRGDAVIASGLAYLARQQSADGAFDATGEKLANTGFSLLAFLSNGNTADNGKYGNTVRRATDFLVRQAPADRYFGQVDGSRMRGHAIVTLALCEAYGVEPDEQARGRIRAIAADAVAILVTAQSITKDAGNDGGWDSERTSVTSDPDISNWCFSALRTAKQIGLNVPAANVDRAAAYLARRLRANPATQPEKGFELERRYFVIQAALRADDARWPALWKAACDDLLARQLADGGWTASTAPEVSGRVHATSVAILELALADRLLPVSQK